MVDKGSLAELEARFDDAVSVGHVLGTETPKLPFTTVEPQGPGRANLSGGRKHRDPRVVTSESW